MRIIAGTHRNTRLHFPAAATRPTSERVRESIFSIIRNIVPEARVLDLYAGTGALGLESLSRGAQSCHFVESDKAALACLRKNIAKTTFKQTRISDQDVSNFLAPSLPPNFDLIFADPPYSYLGRSDLAQSLLEKTLPLTTGGYLLLETEADRNPLSPPDELKLIKERTYGKTSIFLFEKIAE